MKSIVTGKLSKNKNKRQTTLADIGFHGMINCLHVWCNEIVLNKLVTQKCGSLTQLVD